MKLTRKLPTSVRGVRLALIAMVVTAAVSALCQSFKLGYNYQLFRCVHPSLLPHSRLYGLFLSFEGSHALAAILALVLSAFGLRTRKVVGFLVSLIALIGLGGIYILWYLGTLSIMEMGSVKDFSSMPDQQQYLLPLYQATWWDIVVLGVALIVFVWQVAMLRRALKPVSENRPTAESG